VRENRTHGSEGGEVTSLPLTTSVIRNPHLYLFKLLYPRLIRGIARHSLIGSWAWGDSAYFRFEAGHRFVRDKSIKSFKDKVRTLTKRSRSGSISEIIGELNPMLRGWFNYFKQAHHSTFKRNDGFVRRRLRSIILKRNKKKNCFGITVNAHRLYPNTYFANLNLFTSNEAWVKAYQSR